MPPAFRQLNAVEIGLWTEELIQGKVKKLEDSHLELRLAKQPGVKN